MSGVDWCVAQGIADPERLGVMGGSYGGYMTNWVIGHTQRFKAAVSMFGIFHLQTDYSNSELSRWDNDYLGAYYWEDPEIYRRLSPGSYIEAIKTPTLIIHGDEDTNTFISNSKELYQALRHRGVTTQFVHYPREGHGVREPNHKLDEMRRCLAWMDKYVRHGGAKPDAYRIGDRVPNADGTLELNVTKAEIATFLGQTETRSRHQRPERPRTAGSGFLPSTTWTRANPATPLNSGPGRHAAGRRREEMLLHPSLPVFHSTFWVERCWWRARTCVSRSILTRTTANWRSGAPSCTVFRKQAARGCCASPIFLPFVFNGQRRKTRSRRTLASNVRNHSHPANPINPSSDRKKIKESRVSTIYAYPALC